MSGAKRVLLVAVGTVFLFDALGEFSLARSSAVLLSPNEVLKELGHFDFCDGKYSVEIASLPSGKTSLSILRNQRQGRGAVDSYPVFKIGGIPSTNDWFVSLDEFKRLWIFVGPSSEGDETSRNPYTVVYLFGHAFDQNGKLAHRTEQVSITGNWAGVPGDFLSRVHSSLSRLDDLKLGPPQTPRGFTPDELKAVLPQTPPGFTPEQMAQLAEAIRQPADAGVIRKPASQRVHARRRSRPG
jgi:hypothetical protein